MKTKTNEINTKENIEELVIRAKDGDNDAVQEIIKRYRGLVIKEAAKYKIPSYDFEDVVQHGYLTIIKSIEMYKENSSAFNGYVINAIRNNFYALLKGKIKNYREVPDDTLLDLDFERYDFTIEDQIIAYDEVKRLYRALDILSEEERRIIDEFYFENKALKEIACEGNKDYGKTFRMKKKALNKLRKAIEKEEKLSF